MGAQQCHFWPCLWFLAALFCNAGAVLKVPACHPSVGDFIREDPNLSIWLPDISSFSPPGDVYQAACPGDVPYGFTVFVPSNDGVPATLAALDAQAAVIPDAASSAWYEILTGNATVTLTMPNGTLCSPVKVATPKANAISLYNQLPQGAFSAEQLLAAGDVPTALSIVTHSDAYNMHFYRGPGGQVCINSSISTMNASCIMRSYFGCDGVMHVINNFQLPTNRPDTTPATMVTMYDIPVEDLEPLRPISNCSDTLGQALARAKDATWWSGIVAGLSTPDLLRAFQSSNTSVTVFAESDGAYNALLSNETISPDFWQFPRLRLGVLTQTLPQPYCATELLQAGNVTTVYGKLSGTGQSLFFSLDKDGKILVRGIGNSTAHIVREEEVCGSMLYIVDGFLPVAEANITATQVEKYLVDAGTMLVSPRPTLGPVRCGNDSRLLYTSATPPAVSPGAAPAPPPAAGLSSGAIAGIAVGAVAGAALALLAAWLLVTRRRQRRQLQVDGDEVHFTSKLEDGTMAIGVLEASSDSTSPPGSELQRNRSAAVTSWDIRAEAVTFVLDASGERVVLGRGGFGLVYRGLINGVQPVAVKVLRDPGPECREAFLREVAIMQHVSRDRNVVQFYGTAAAGDELMILSEVMEGGDLRAALSGPRGEEMRWGQRGKGIALDVARGLCFLHANNVIHRDLKSKNILLTGDWACAKIADIGTAAIHNEGYLTTGAGHVIGTLAWAAPEMLLNTKVSSSADIYSFGIFLWELVTRQVPKRGFSELPPPGEHAPPELLALMAACREGDPKLRPTAKEVYDRLTACPQC